MATKIDYIALARRQHEADEEEERQLRIIQARDLYAGWLSDDMITRLTESFLAEDAAALVQQLGNFVAVVVDEIADRLAVLELASAGSNAAATNTGTTAQAQAGGAATPAPTPTGNAAATGTGQPAAEFQPAPQWAVDFWNRNRLNQLQHDIYLMALRDGMAYVLLQPEMDHLTKTPYIRAYIHERYTAAEVEGPSGNGTGEGIMAHYGLGDTLTLNKRPLLFSKRWTETVVEGEDEESFQRMTLFIEASATEPGRVEKYRQENDEWGLFKDEGDTANPLPWPYPVAVIEFANTGKQQQGRKAVGLQMAIDNVVTALVSAASTAAVPSGFIVGAHPTNDGQPISEDGDNMWRFGPGRMNGIPGKSPAEVKMEWMKPGDLSQVIEAINQLIKLMSITSNAPSLLSSQLGSIPPSARLMQQLDLRVVAAVKRVQDSFGDSWAQVFDTAAALSVAFMKGVQVDPLQKVQVVWQPADLLGHLFDEGEAEPMADLTPEATGAAATGGAVAVAGEGAGEVATE